MTISLIVMLAAETYFSRFFNLHLSSPAKTGAVYKLVRFYEPSSEAEYETTRATLTVFSTFSYLPAESHTHMCLSHRRVPPFIRYFCGRSALFCRLRQRSCTGKDAWSVLSSTNRSERLQG